MKDFPGGPVVVVIEAHPFQFWNVPLAFEDQIFGTVAVVLQGHMSSWKGAVQTFVGNF